MKKLLVLTFLFLSMFLGKSFHAKAATKGVLQYCFYQGQWSLLFKWDKNFKNNKTWCKIVKKNEDEELYNELFKNTIGHNGKWYIETRKLRRIVDKHEAIAKKYKKIEENLLAKQKAEEEKRTLLAKQKAEEEKRTLLAKQKAEEEEKYKINQDQDKEAPVVKISKSLTVNDANYTISGTVSDKSNKIFIEVDGQFIKVKDGKFNIKRYSPTDEQVKIVATDKWGNKSKPILVNVIVDLKNRQFTERVQPLNPKKIKSKKTNDRVALIIGIEKYNQTPAANFANLDATFFYEYARNSFGISKSNIKLLINEDANLISSLGALKKWLPGKIKANKTELIVFFAGHGLGSKNGEKLYILPQDSDPDLLERTAISREELLEIILELNPKKVTMFFDTCYSGISRDEKMLLASARPVRIVASEIKEIPDKITIFSASQFDQISSSLSQEKHGIFSYYLMKGFEGNADLNDDGKITNGELIFYVNNNVSQKAAELGRKQNPSLIGDPNKIVISY